jgi:hypothetical protein
MITIAVFGAAGNMGARVVRAFQGDPDYTLLFVEGGDAGLKKLAERGLAATPADQAARSADVVVFAVPDVLIGRVAADVVPHLRPGAMAMCLDPAAPRAGRLPQRSDITYFITHPAHPPVFNDETDPEARRDFFGSGRAKQAIVCALMQGPETDYARGEKIAARMFGPILRSHRVTVEQMALLEPALSETLAATCLSVIREGLDEVAARGVPYEAARDFLMGHINIELAILFNEIDWKFSAGAQFAIAEAKKALFQPDWKKIFEPDSVMTSVVRISGGQ